MEIWREIYADEPPWSKNCHGKTLNLGATIASEFARLIMVEFESKITGSKRAEYLQKQYERLTKQLRVKLEEGCAVGGIMFKPYVRNGVILPDCITQDKFIPLSYSNGIITSAVFLIKKLRVSIITRELKNKLTVMRTNRIQSKVTFCIIKS